MYSIFNYWFTYVVIAVYNCSAMALADCSTCISFQYDVTMSKFNCKWCQNGCQLQTTCGGFLQNTCPPPRIEKVGFQLTPLQCRAALRNNVYLYTDVM